MSWCPRCMLNGDSQFYSEGLLRDETRCRPQFKGLIKLQIYAIFLQVNNYVIFSGFFKDQPQPPLGVQQKKPRIYMGKLQYV